MDEAAIPYFSAITFSKADGYESPCFTKEAIIDLNSAVPENSSAFTAKSSSSSIFPLSLPKHMASILRVEESSFTPPYANCSALPKAYTAGSSNTISAPQARAIRVLKYLSQTAGAPRCTKSPLMITTAMSAPVIAFAFSIRYLCPLWNGLNSAMIPTVFMGYLIVH